MFDVEPLASWGGLVDGLPFGVRIELEADRLLVRLDGVNEFLSGGYRAVVPDAYIKDGGEYLVTVRPVAVLLDGVPLFRIEDALSLDQSEFDEDGFDLEGFDRQGFDRQGFNSRRVDRGGYGVTGYDSSGFNRDGLNRNGDRWGDILEGYRADPKYREMIGKTITAILVDRVQGRGFGLPEEI